jgi:hypothetical protein
VDYYRQIETPGKLKLHLHKFPLSAKVGTTVVALTVPMFITGTVMVQSEFSKRAYQARRSGTDVPFQRRDKLSPALDGQTVGPKPACETYAGKPGKLVYAGGKIAGIKAYVDNPPELSRRRRFRTGTFEQFNKFSFRINTPLGKHGKMGVSINHSICAGNEICHMVFRSIIYIICM